MADVRPMTAADLPLGLRLSRQAGWNQTEPDWRRFLALQPDGCFVAEREGVAVGTCAAFIFGPVAWVAMVLVEPSARGRGVGTALMRHALAFLDGRGVRAVRLDATPLGRPIYEKLGFAAEYELRRYEGILQRLQSPTRKRGNQNASLALRAWTGDDHLAGIARLDRAVTGADRERLLRQLSAERPELWRVAEAGGEVVGYLASRPGARAWQIGPCLAEAEAGPALLADAWQRHAGQAVFVDVPAGNTAAVAVVEGQGLTPQRTLLRMCRGPAPGEDVGRLWASSGPEKG